MLESLLAAFAFFAASFVIMRVLEWAYHRIRHTKDWSPHWGTWLFAVLIGIYTFIVYYGR